MNAIVEQALSLWGAQGADYSLIAARENAVYRITDSQRTFALRLHREGYRTDQELMSELHWMDAVAKGGIIVPKPIPSQSGSVLHVIDGIQVDALSWLSGAPLAQIFDQLSPQKRAALFEDLGRTMARLHEVSDAWTMPDDFTRCAWHSDGLLGDAPLWDRFWDNPQLTQTERALFLSVRKIARKQLHDMQGSLEYGLIHADLVSANVMVDGDALSLIDFDDGGFGFRVFELATALLKFIDDPDFEDLKKALIKGYTSVRQIDLSALDLFMVLRALTYVGWNIARLQEDGGTARNARFIGTAHKLATHYMQRFG